MKPNTNKIHQMLILKKKLFKFGSQSLKIKTLLPGFSKFNSLSNDDESKIHSNVAGEVNIFFVIGAII